MTFIGAFPRYRALTMLAATGVIVTAAYHLWALQRMFLGKFREEWRQSKYLEPTGGKFPEINGRELLTIAPLAVLVLVLGFWPRRSSPRRTRAPSRPTARSTSRVRRRSPRTLRSPRTASSPRGSDPWNPTPSTPR